MTPAVEVILAASALAGTAGACTYYAAYAVRTQWLGPVLWRGRADTASVALTFDDGPSKDTEEILTTLSSYGIRGTFFMIGRQVERHPDIARRVAAMGHEIGNHSYSHPIFLYRTPRDTYREIAHTQEVIERVTGVRPVWSRPPCGVRTPAYFRATRALRLPTVQWTVAGFDWQKRSAADIARRVLRDAGAGSIILLHDGATRGRRDRRETVAALPALIDGLKTRGLRFASLTDLLDPATVNAGGRTDG